MDKDAIKKIIKQTAVFHWKAAKQVSLVTGFLVWGALLSGVMGLLIFIATLPDVTRLTFQDLKKVAESHIVASEFSGSPLYHWIPPDQASPAMINAIISGEDSLFFEHKGIDIPALLIAMGENMRLQDKLIGASTISQQVCKNLFLSRDKTYIRKIKELFITLDLENTFSKQEILEIYINIAGFGPNIYGVSAASRYYFDKPASEINAAEGAFIALMLPAPVKYHHQIFKAKQLSNRHKMKITRILKEMKYKDIITQSDYELYEHYDYFGVNQ